MVRKIRTVLGYVGISLILIVSTFSANMPVVNAEEAVQESTDIQEESRQTDFPETEKSEVESREPDQEDAADTESKQTDDRTPDSTRVGTVNEENEETEEGFLVLSDTAEFVYKCTDVYDPTSEGGVPWNDPTIAVQWPELDVPYKTSEKDEKHEAFATQDFSWAEKWL